MLKEIFSQKLHTQSKTVNNAIITLGDTDVSGNGRKFTSRFIQPGVAGYPEQYGNVLIKKETFDKFIRTMVGKPVIINHKDEITEADKVGEIHNVWFNPQDGWFWCDGVIDDITAQNLITDKGWSVSCSYNVLLADDEGGTENNIKYDMEFLNGVFTHLAIVENPRYERANIVFNSKTEILNANFDPNQKRNALGQWTKEDYNAQIDRILKGELKSSDMIKVLEQPAQPWLEAGLQDAPMFISVKTYAKATKNKHHVTEATMRNLPDLLNDPLYIFESSTVKGSYVGLLDDFEIEKGVKKPLIAAIKPEQGQININIIPSIYGKDPDFEYREALSGHLLYERTQNKTVSNNIVASIATEALKPPINIIDYIEQNFNPKEQEMLNNVENNHTVHNAKEQEMALLEELKKLITKVENDKGDNMEIQNEKVDKRKLIDEVGGILKGKVSEEDWRTIIGKIEKIGYNKSEAGSADNEKDCDKKDDKKVENETEKDKEKVEELKKDVKEDVENKKKCDNTVDNAKSNGFFDKLNEVYNSAMKAPEENIYVSKADKLQAAEEYFKK